MQFYARQDLKYVYGGILSPSLVFLPLTNVFIVFGKKTPLECKRLHKAAAFITFNLFIKLPSQPLLMPPDLSPQILSIAY